MWSVESKQKKEKGFIIGKAILGSISPSPPFLAQPGRNHGPAPSPSFPLFSSYLGQN